MELKPWGYNCQQLIQVKGQIRVQQEKHFGCHYILQDMDVMLMRLVS